MSRSIHLIARTIPGYGPHDGSRYLIATRIFEEFRKMHAQERRIAAMKEGKKIEETQAKSKESETAIGDSSSSSYRRNLDFSKQNRHGYSRYLNNRHNETMEEYEDLEDSETLSSKNGPLLSVSRNQKYQATATAGPRPDYIFEHFRKMHAQERKIAAMKEGKKIEETQAKSKESETAIGDSSSSSYRRNLDFSKQNRHGYSRYLNNRHNETMEEYEDLEDSETLSSKNGPLLSVSRNQKYQATATAGPRPDYIFEYFRKMHAQERKIAAMKEGKKIEETQAKSKESETAIGDSSSSSYRRNLDFSKQNRHGYSHYLNNRHNETMEEYSRYLNNRHNETMEEYEDLEDSETLSSKNGPLLSVSRNQKYQATATAGPRPKDIFEEFRKMHAQEREKAAMKEGKKIEETQAKSKESETVGSLLKLFRMSVQQGKKSNNTANNKDFILDQDKQIAPLTEERSTSIISDSTGSVKHEIQEIPRPELTRPKSNFRIPEIKFRPPVFKRSPVPEIKFQPPVFTEETGSSMISMEPEACEEIQDDEYDSESDLDPLDEILDDKVPEIDETGNADVAKEEATVKSSSLLGMKLTELRALAKSRSMKGFSKLKKKELIEVLSGC